MTGLAGAAPEKPSTIVAVEVTREQPAGIYAGVTYRYVEGVIRGEVSAAGPVAGLGELAAGRATVPYEIAFHIIAPELASEADAVVVEAPNRGNNILARTIGVLPSHDSRSPPSNGRRVFPAARRRARKGSAKSRCGISAAGSAARSEAGRRPCRSSAIASWPA